MVVNVADDAVVKMNKRLEATFLRRRLIQYI